MDRKQIIVSLPEALVKEAGHLGVELGLNRGRVIALLLREALDARAQQRQQLARTWTA